LQHRRRDAQLTSGACGCVVVPTFAAKNMMEVCTIAPLPHEPGLVAYECTHCGPVTTELQRPIEGQSCLFPKA